MNKRIVITGWGVASPFGLTNEDFETSFNSKVGYIKTNDWEKEGIGEQYFGRIPDFDILKIIPSLRPPFPNRYSSIGLLACLNALKDADLHENQELLNETGLILSTTLGASAAIQTFLSKLYKKGPDRLSPFNFSKATSNSILGDISRILGLKGPGSLVYGEESFSYGIDLIDNDHAEIIVCGGVDELTELNVFLANEKERLLPTQAKSAFEHITNSVEEDQYIFSESSSFLVIESVDSATKRGAKIYAEITDYKQFRDEYSSKVSFERSTKDLKNNLASFIEKNNVDNEHELLFYGSSCLPWNIKSYEWKALHELPYKFRYANSKTSIGGGLAGSSNCTLISSLLSYSNNKLANVFKDSTLLQKIPKNISLEDLNEDNELTTIVHTFSLGGSNTLLILKNYHNE